MYFPRRVVFRALVVGLGEFVLARMLVPESGRGFDAAEFAAYPLVALFLAIPAALVTLVEVLAERRPRAVVFAVSTVVAVIGVTLAHIQAAYASSVLASGSLPGGIEGLADHLTLLRDHEATPVLVLFLLGLAAPFPFVALLTLARALVRTRVVVNVLVTIVVALAMEPGRLYWRVRFLESAATIAVFSLPFLCALADRLAGEKPQPDEQSAK